MIGAPLAALVLAGAAVVGAFYMVIAGWGFAWLYFAGIPPWIHSVIATLLCGFAAAMVWRARMLCWSVLRSRVAALIAVVAVIGGFGWSAWRPVPSVPGARRDAVVYLLGAIGHIRHYALRRDSVDWRTVTDSALHLAVGAQRPRDTYPAIRFVLGTLGDHHSGLIEAGYVPRLATGPAPDSIVELRRQRLPEGRLTPDGIGYLLVPGFLTGLTDRDAYVHGMRTLLADLDRRQPCGWIVDLRRNVGGNMWPMLDGLAPLLPEGRFGGVVMPQFGRHQDWWLIGGHATALPFYEGLGLRGPGHLRLSRGGAPVAVLIGGLTASAGEAAAIAFKGRPDTRYVGTATSGLSTANESVTLSDGATAVVTIGVDVDRLGQRYGGALQPDDTVPGWSMADSSAALRAAAAWITARSHCSTR